MKVYTQLRTLIRYPPSYDIEIDLIQRNAFMLSSGYNEYRHFLMNITFRLLYHIFGNEESFLLNLKHNRHSMLFPFRSLVFSSSENLSPTFDHSKHLKHDTNEHRIYTTNQSYTVPLSKYNTTNINISERQVDIDKQNNQNISKLEDILSDVSLSTFLEPSETAKQGTTEIKSPKKENTVLKTDENSTFNSKLHPIFGDKSWAQSLFKECINYYDEYKENPERILDDHFDRIWRTREALILLEDQVDLQNAFQKHSKKPSKARRKYQANKNNDNAHHNLINFKKSVKVTTNNEQTYWNCNISQYVNKNKLNNHEFNTNRILSNEHFNQFNQSQLIEYSYYTQLPCKSYHSDKYYIEYDNLFNKVNNDNFVIHSNEIITDDLNYNTFAYIKRKNYNQNTMIIHSRRHSFFIGPDESEYVSNRKYHSNSYLLQNSISLPNMIKNKHDLLLNNFIICVVYVSEDSLPHVILCKNNQWTLKLFKKKVIQQLYSTNPKLQREVYNELQNLKKRFYFKTESNELNTNMIYYEIIDDGEEIPRWKDLIWAKIEIDHN
ncbi:hypothetical protein MN116_003238 [Schistosoma mekongi]|uniref:DIX domain-containing protein n=1 Tax=Schistosoma mekongi TaxID=38744 RepID=A0AAE1ZH81_SCHME|nr:hypothetical protein MN116_003238 [Schistosoma mekongi]